MSTDESKQEQWEPVKLGRFSIPQVLVVLIGWVVLYGIGSLFVSNPFFTEPYTGADINYFHTMYLHGLLISLVGVLALVVCHVFKFRSKHVRLAILWGVVVAVILATFGGFINTDDKSLVILPQMISYFALDDILVSLFIGFYIELMNGSESSRLLPFWNAMIGTVGLFAAAVMGHIAGFTLTFGDGSVFTPLLASYAAYNGEKVSDLLGNMVTGHSHLMIVAMLSVLVSLAAMQFGYQKLQGGARSLSRVAFWIVIAGTVITLIMYVLGGFTTIQPPTWFQSLASDDFVSGVGIMVGGLLVLLAMLMGRSGAGSEPGWLKPALTAIGTAWISLVLFVVGGGYYIEFHENLFGAGDQTAPLHAADAVFTFVHQDFAFYILPGVIVLLLLADIYLKRNNVKGIATGMLTGVLVALIGVFVYVFATPNQLYGAGYFILALGLVVLVLSAVLVLRGLAVDTVEKEKVVEHIKQTATSYGK